MEKESIVEREREKEKEPIILRPDFPYMFRSRAEQKKYISSLPRVIHMDETPEIQPPGRLCLRVAVPAPKKYLPRGTGAILLAPYIDYKELKYPVYTMTAHLNPGRSNPVNPGEWSGHRHFEEAVFYMPGGAGWEEQDGVRWEWKGEGIVCVPSYAIHKHGMTEPADRGIWTVISHIYEYLGIADFEQTNRVAQQRILERTKGRWPQVLSTNC